MVDYIVLVLGIGFECYREVCAKFSGVVDNLHLAVCAVE